MKNVTLFLLTYISIDCIVIQIILINNHVIEINVLYTNTVYIINFKFQSVFLFITKQIENK